MVVLGCVGLLGLSLLFAEPEEALDPDRFEFAILPALNYDSDLGLGFGASVVLAQFDRDYAPYRWRLSVQALTAIRAPRGSPEFTFHDDVVRLDVPGLSDGLLRLNLQVAFRRLSTSGWYGLGSESTIRVHRPEALIADPGLGRDQQFLRTFPSLRGVTRFALYDERVPVGKRRLELFGGAELSRSWISLYPNSQLADEAARAADPHSADDRVLAELLHGTQDHWLFLGLLGLLWDSRDHETVPSTGAFHELSLRASPGVDAGLDYLGLTLSLSWYWCLFDPWLVLATRVVGDALVGDPPLYALSSFGALQTISGPGGSASTRGVLLDRFHGKFKILANAEVRARFLPMTLWDQHFELGAALFFDAGRVWADARGRSLDGRPLDGGLERLQIGMGGGLRYRWGETFLLRAELGWSPTDGTSGVYIDVDQAF